MNTKFIQRLNALLIEKGMKQADLAKLSGIRASSISDWLAGKYAPKQDKIDALAKALNVSPAWLMGYGEDEKHISPISSKKETSAAEALPPLSPRDERQIARDLEKMLADLDDKNDLAALGGTVEDAEDRELLRASLLTSMRLAKQIAKKKFTPKKYRKDDIE